MPRHFYQRLQEYFSDIGKVLKGEADSASIFPNTTDIGMSRERIYSEVLRLHLPSSCNVYYGGFVFDLDGNESKQIDLIVSNDKSIQFNFHNQDGSGKSFACIDGCIAVASIKSTLDSAQIRDSLDNLASLPDKSPLDGRQNPLIRINNYEDWPYKIVYASDGVSAQTASSTIDQFYLDNPSIPIHKRPNLIHVAGKYLFIRVNEGATTRDGTQLKPNSFHCQTGHVDEYGIPYAVTSIQEISTASNQVVFKYGEIINKIPMGSNA